MIDEALRAAYGSLSRTALLFICDAGSDTRLRTNQSHFNNLEATFINPVGLLNRE
jgi:hypothetical protein